MHLAKKVFFGDMIFTVPKQVYEPAEDSFLLVENLDLNAEDTVLDIGTGCGIVSVVAAKKAKHVVAVDINPCAVDCVRKNAEVNSVAEKIDVRLGNLFEPIEKNERFSVIAFNAPYLPSESQNHDDWVEKAWEGGQDGLQLIDRFISEVPKFLASGGRIFLVQSTLSNVEKTLQQFRSLGFQAKIVAGKSFFFEKIVVVMAAL